MKPFSHSMAVQMAKGWIISMIKVFPILQEFAERGALPPSSSGKIFMLSIFIDTFCQI